MTRRTSPCKGCGRPILWAVDGAGQRIPLDPSAPVYFVARENNGGTPIVQRNANAFVTHFATCPRASEFSGSRKKGGTPGAGADSEGRREDQNPT